MIRRLRTQHRLIMTALAVVLPLLFIAGLKVRRTFPNAAKLPEQEVTSDRSERFLPWEEVGLLVRFQKDERGKSQALLDVIPSRDFDEPDLLVFWDEQDGNDGKIHERAVLLGSLKGRQLRRMKVPFTVPPESGHIVLYSLAHAKVIGAGRWRIEGRTQ